MNMAIVTMITTMTMTITTATNWLIAGKVR